MWNFNLGEETKRYLRGITYAVIILIAGYFIFRYYSLKVESTQTINLLQQEIIKRDTTIQIVKGKYSKLVNTFATAKQLQKQVEANNKLLADTIKARNEKILSITTANIKFADKKGTVTSLIPLNNGDTTFTFSSYYPNKDKYMAKFTGDVNIKSKKVGETWEFQKFPLGIILTQRKDGLWDYYVDAPEYAEVSNIKINSLPPTEYSKPKVPVFGLWGGLGVRSNVNRLGSMNNKDIVIKGGVSVKNKFILTGDVATDKTVGLGFLIKL